MQNIKIQETENTPSVDFDFRNGNLEIRGVSFPEYAKEFYEPILEALREYANHPSTKKTVLNFKFTYFNTGTNSFITDLFKELERLNNLHNHKVEIFWYYEEEDEDMKELGDYFDSLTHLPVKFIPCEEI